MARAPYPTRMGEAGEKGKCEGPRMPRPQLRRAYTFFK